ncbi:MAG: indolepyruvate ferredoxin oxidoreductase subunit alpha [Desulfobacteraceae bacterium]|nr:MAG: indolepyruvate ferredoxin oxidoreductase subunit alpha [Desulfobacteraceae bacterium]
MHKLLEDSPGKGMLLLGNEAIARGAIEAGIAVATCYPGTPSSEISDNFFTMFKENGFYFEYSTNEKVALEVAAGAAISGVRSICTMKHVGMNVASDTLMTLAYLGVNAGMVIINADDPLMFSSQNEQDNRYYARLSGLPMMEPKNAQEMKDMTVAAFDLSEQLKLPVVLRTTTRLNHLRGMVKFGQIRQIKSKGFFKKDPFHYVAIPAVSRNLHKLLLEKYDQALELSEDSEYNQIIGNGKWGIVTNGVSLSYVQDAVNDLGIGDKVTILRLGFSYPMPENMIVKFLTRVEKVLVVEELEPVMENDIRSIAQSKEIVIPIKGKEKGLFSRLYEFDPGMVRKTIASYFGVPDTSPEMVDVTGVPDLPGRPPNLCAGCPHRAMYYAIKQVYGPDAVHPSDIGCYTLGILPPLKMADIVICMGASVGTSCGISKATDQKVVSFIGDSTFFHAGIPALINAVHNNHKFTLVILDNGTTAMTGNQPHPGVDTTPMGVDTTQISIESMVRGCGVEHVQVVNPLQVKKSIAAAQASKDFDGISVIISKELCPLYARAIKKAKKVRPFYVNQDKCKQHLDCINLLACPAMYIAEGKTMINEVFCIGCTVCAQVCPENAIVPLKR